jgi:RNA polymerase sigma-70 factor (ECF subfamily)
VTAIVEGELRSSVVRLAAAGDETAFARIIELHHEDLIRVAYLVTGEVELAHEAVQSAWLLAWRKLGGLRDDSRLKPWLVTVAANEARQLVRRRRRRRLVEIPVEELGPDLEPEAAEHADRDELLDLLTALRHLDPDDRAILAMRFAAGLTSDEIGRATGMSAPGVRSKVARALARLRRELARD